MSKLHKLLLSTAIVGFAALPVAALTVDTNAQLGAYNLVYPQPDPDDSVGPATGDAAASVAGSTDAAPQPDPDDSVGPATGDAPAPSAETATDGGATVAQPDPDDSVGPATGDAGGEGMVSEPAMAPGLALDESSAFVGNRVVSSDGAEVGVVREVVLNADGAQILVIVANGGTADEKLFTLTLDGSATADGEISLGWTQAELTEAISAL